MVLLKNIDIGNLGHFEYSYDLIRLGFMKSMTHIAIVPILHRNINTFMEMHDIKTYISYKTLLGRMMALTLDGHLTTWILSTGKLHSRAILEEHDYSEYELFSGYK